MSCIWYVWKKTWKQLNNKFLFELSVFKYVQLHLQNWQQRKSTHPMGNFKSLCAFQVIQISSVLQFQALCCSLEQVSLLAYCLTTLWAIKYLPEQTHPQTKRNPLDDNFITNFSTHQIPSTKIFCTNEDICSLCVCRDIRTSQAFIRVYQYFYF